MSATRYLIKLAKKLETKYAMPETSSVKKGNLVEFTRDHQDRYTFGDGEFGVATENERPDHTVMLELADGSNYLAKHIHAFGWAGWFPDELEVAYGKHNGIDFDGNNDYGD